MEEYEMLKQAAMLRKIADYAVLGQKISNLPNCHDCKKAAKRSCEYRPIWGDPVRYNCPLWEANE